MNPFPSNTPGGTYPVEEKLYTGYIKDENIITILGNSATENVASRYHEVIRDTRKHFMTSGNLTVYIYLMKVNVPATLQLYRVMKELARYSQAGKEVKVYWLTEERTGKLREVGKGLKSTFRLDFSLSTI